MLMVIEYISETYSFVSDSCDRSFDRKILV